MARVVCVHGIGRQHSGEGQLLRDWLPALEDGLRRAGRHGPSGTADVAMAYYGDLFRPAGQVMSPGDPPFSARDVDAGLEEELLLAWWAEAAAVDDGVVLPGADSMARTPSVVQAALFGLAKSRFFAGVALRSLVFDLKQVSRYLTDEGLRAGVQERLRTQIGPETRVVVAHSLGSVVAYEVLCALGGEHGVRALVTLGSPLGIPNLIVDRLEPVRRTGKVGWPGGAGFSWTNVVDRGDVVALRKDLQPVFGDPLGEVVHGRVVHNGSHAHDATRYLSDAVTGEAVGAGWGAA